jgi:ElaB/YqjD/DUF883 family membrane-anchored ribosome-binding protein
MNAARSNEPSMEKLLADFRAVVNEAEELLKASAGESGEKLSVVRARISEKLADLKGKLEEAQGALVDRSKQAARAADDYVHDNPWQAMAVAGGVGLLIGLLIARR